jgi:hypothetical protein
MSQSPPTPHGDPLALEARWTIEERDYHDQARAIPASTLQLFRWPVAFFIAFASVGMSDPNVGVPFALGVSTVISLFWLVIGIASRGSQFRAAAKLPIAQRSMHLWIDDQRWVVEVGDGSAFQFPRSSISHGKISPNGVLLSVAGQAWLIPWRSMITARSAWEMFADSLPPWPRNLKLTIGLWLAAIGFAIWVFVGR